MHARAPLLLVVLLVAAPLAAASQHGAPDEAPNESVDDISEPDAAETSWGTFVLIAMVALAVVVGAVMIRQRRARGRP